MAADGLGRDARHLLRHGSAAGLPPAAARPSVRPNRRAVLPVRRRTRSSRSSRPMRQIPARSFRHRTRRPRGSRATCSNSSPARCGAADCRRRCCRCSRGSATWPTPCSRVWTAGRSGALTALHRGAAGRVCCDMLRGRAVLNSASATALTLSPAAHGRTATSNLRATTTTGSCCGPQDITNHPEIVRRLGCLAMNGMVEADIYGNVNSTHILGIEHAERHRRLRATSPATPTSRCSSRPSVAKGGAISCIVPMVTPRRPHRARRGRDRDRTRRGRPARAGAATACSAGSSTTASIRTTGPHSRTTSTGPTGRRGRASTRRTCSTRRCPGTSPTSATARCARSRFDARGDTNLTSEPAQRRREMANQVVVHAQVARVVVEVSAVCRCCDNAGHSALMVLVGQLGPGRPAVSTAANSAPRR